MPDARLDVRYAADSNHLRSAAVLPPGADMHLAKAHVSFVPTGDIARLP
jgi:hypothetical protein